MKRNTPISRKAICMATLTGSMFFLNSCQLFQSEPTPQIFSPRQIVPAPQSAPKASYEQRTPAFVAPKEEIKPVDMEITEVEPVIEETEPAVERTVVEAPKLERVVYTVRKGDSLWKIGRRYGVSYQELAAENGLDAKKHLKVGMKLTIPSGGKFRTDEEIKSSTPKKAYQPKFNTKPVLGSTKKSSGSKKSSTAKKESIPADGMYTVKKGDSLWVIARRFDLRHKDIMAINGLTSANLKVGQKLKLTGSASSSTASYSEPTIDTTPTEPVETDPVRVDTTPEDTGVIIDDNNTSDVGETDTPTTVEGAEGGETSGDTGIAVEPEPSTEGTELVPVEVYDGDTLESIAQDFSSTVELIKAANPTIKSNADLKEGMMLKIPLKE